MKEKVISVITASRRRTGCVRKIVSEAAVLLGMSGSTSFNDTQAKTGDKRLKYILTKQKDGWESYCKVSEQTGAALVKSVTDGLTLHNINASSVKHRTGVDQVRGITYHYVEVILPALV